MNKAQLIRAVAKNTGISVAKAGLVVEAFMKSVIQAHEDGDDTGLSGIGSFSTESAIEVVSMCSFEEPAADTSHLKATWH
ncbi:HU family DNA-binding protein [Pseudomonas mosselii]|uniref:HU family DNA-binding protein n=1 Tax=Pseudomonas mosselii TaxID=78327 RepID=UPI000D8FF431|nr:HU family DNA-binding protein [Pseudomonas mosselii]PYC28874.1 hypothetical protein DMX06_01510 [Pseudomonas mosselii]